MRGVFLECDHRRGFAGVCSASSEHIAKGIIGKAVGLGFAVACALNRGDIPIIIIILQYSGIFNLFELP